MEEVTGFSTDDFYGVLVPVSENSEIFHSKILLVLQDSYLHEESRQSFRYNSAFLINNSILNGKYETFRTKKRRAGYTEADLEESYGFLLFEDRNKANKLSETGVVIDHSTCTTLGDPSKGVYISKYSDCLDLNRWYNGKSGYIAIIRLTKGIVKNVSENYTQNFTDPSKGCDCHMSEQISAVSANTSSFLAFERTQYYMYEFLDDGNNTMAQSPSHVCPFAIVSFSYGDTNVTHSEQQEKSAKEKKVCHYFPWRGHIQIFSQCYHVGLKSRTGPLIPAKLPAIIEIGRAIAMLELKQILPKSVFETCFSGEGKVCCRLYELVPYKAWDSSLSLLTRELKKKDIALIIELKDNGFLILIHSSNFLTFEDSESNTTEVLQALFVFPTSRDIHRETKLCRRKPLVDSEVMQVLPALSYAETEVEKQSTDQSGELCTLMEKHIQSYAALIHPGLANSPSREVSIFPDQYEVPDALKYLYSTPKWTDGAWQHMVSYIGQPISFQLSVARAVELLAAEQEERGEEPEDEVYFCLSSPEGGPHESLDRDDISFDSSSEIILVEKEKISTPPETVYSDFSQPTESTVKILEDLPSNVSKPIESTVQMLKELPSDVSHPTRSGKMPQDFLPKLSHPIALSKGIPKYKFPDFSPPTESTRDFSKSETGLLASTDCLLTKAPISPITVDLPKELVVSFTSAESTVLNMSLITSCAVPSKKHCVFQTLPKDKLEILMKDSLIKKNERAIPSPYCPEVSNLPKMYWTKLPRCCRRGGKVSSKYRRMLRSSVVKDREPTKEFTPNEMEKTVEEREQVKEDEPMDKKDQGEENEILNKEVLDLEERLFSTEVHPLKRKTERWELREVTTKCGRIFVPHGFLGGEDQKQARNWHKFADEEHYAEQTFVNVSALNPLKVDLKKDTGLSVNMRVRNRPIFDRKSVLNTHVRQINSEQGHKSTNVDGVKDSLTRKINKYGVDIAKVHRADMYSSDVFHGKHSSSHSPVQVIKKREFLPSKLKTVLLMGKRKISHPDLNNAQLQDDAEDNEPLVKNNKLETDIDKQYADLNSTDKANMTKTVHRNAITEALPLDPDLAQALGLTPKELLVKTQKRKTLVNGKSTKREDRVTLPSTHRFRSRMKILKHHQNISAESIERKWWLHFHTPFVCTSGKLSKQLKICKTETGRKKINKEMWSCASPSTDALNILDDLALGASNDHDSKQPEPGLRRTLKDLEMCDLTEEPQSVLSALQLKTKPGPPTKYPSATGLVGSKEVTVLISKEHAYSLPSSSSLLMGVTGALLQVPPLTRSVGHQLHYKNIHGDELASAEYSEKDKLRGRKYQHLRSFDEKGGSIQVTRLWKDTYNFLLDSKFTNNPKDKAIVRALHGPWDFNITDTPEHVQLIVHMWIGLFYSRSTSRFFHFDSALPSLEENDCALVCCGISPAKPNSKLRTSLFAPVQHSTLKESDCSDLTKRKYPVLNQGSELLDLSIKKSNDFNFAQVGITESSVLDVVRGLFKGCTESKQTYCQEEGGAFHPQYRKPACQVYPKTENSTSKSELDDDNDISPNKKHNISQMGGELRQYGPEPPETESYSCLSEKIAHVCIQHDIVARNINDENGTTDKKILQKAKTNGLINGINNVYFNCDINNLVNAVECDPTNNCYKDPNVMTNTPKQRAQAVQAQVKIDQPVCTRDTNHERHHPNQRVRILKDDAQMEIKDGDRSSAIMYNGTNLDNGVISFHNIDTDSTEQETTARDKESISPTENLLGLDDNSPNKLVVNVNYGDDSTKNMACLHYHADSNDEYIMALQYEGNVKHSSQPIELAHEPVIGLLSDKSEILMQDEVIPQKEANALWGKYKHNIDLNRNTHLSIECVGQTSSQAIKSNHRVLSCFNSEENHLIDGESSHPATVNLQLIHDTRNSQKDTEQVILGSVSDDAILCTHGVFSKNKTLEQMLDQIVIPLIEEKKSRQNQMDTPVSHLQEKAKGFTQSLKEIPFNRGFFIQDLKQPEGYFPSSSQEAYDSDPFFAGKMLPDFETSDSNQQMLSTKNYSPCPSPAVDEKPYNYTICPDISSNFTVFEKDKACKVFNLSERSLTPTQDELPHCQVLSHKQYMTLHLDVEPKSDLQSSELTFVEPTVYQLHEDQGCQSPCHMHNTLPTTSIRRHCSTEINMDLHKEDRAAAEKYHTDDTYSQANWVSDDRDIIRKFSLDKTKLNLFDSLYQCHKGDRLEFEQALDLTGNKIPKWVQFSQDEKIKDFAEGNLDDATISVSSINLNQEENGKTFDKCTILSPSTSSFIRTISNMNREGSISVNQISQRCTPYDLTQSSMNRECLIFSEKMKLLLKDGKRGTSLNKTTKSTSSTCSKSRSNMETSSSCSSLAVHFSSLEELTDIQQLWEALPSVVDQKLKVEWPERCGLAKVTDKVAAIHIMQLSYGKGIEMPHSRVSEVTAECSKTYHIMMKDVCAGKMLLTTTEGVKKDKNNSGKSTHAALCDQMQIDLHESLQNNLNYVVRQSCKIKFRFYMLMTSGDTFFEETKAQLEAEGHNAIQPSQFFLEDISSSLLLVVLRNEDIADYICEVPHLLELKKSPRVLFAGIDRPDDIVNLTHQELFSRGGFVVFEGTALDTINLSNMKIFLKFLEDLSKKGKWKLILHYRDSRQLKENARSSTEAMEKKQFMDCYQEAGMVEVLPYHECDVISRERPNYLNCLLRLQVQNVSTRFPVFITNTTTDGAFGRNGILTININSFLQISRSETCTVS